jgi:hypothetical protein
MNIEIEKVLADHALWLQRKGGSCANLRETDICGADLFGADLRSADICGANLSGTNLRSANLSGADLRSSSLFGADLRGANLRGANLRGANLRRSKLFGANLSGAHLSSADLRYSEGILCLPIHDPRGYRPVAVLGWPDGPMVASGCRWFTLSDAREHWGSDYKGDSAIGDLYIGALDWLEAQLPEGVA